MKEKKMNRILKKLKNKKGFTLVEVTVASLIIVIVSVMVVTIFMSTSNINKQSFGKISDTRGIGYDIYVGTDAEPKVDDVPVILEQNGKQLSDIKIPMDVKTFTGERTDIQMLIFRNR